MGDRQKKLKHTNSLNKVSSIPLSSACEKILSNCEEVTTKLLEVNESSTNESIETLLITSVQELVRICYSDAEVYLFGSRLSLTSLNKSDLDIYIDCDNSYNAATSVESCRKILETIWDCLKEFKDIWMAKSIILRARVPIIKLKHKETNLECDISCSNGIAVEKSKLIRCYVQAFPPCQKLILFLKKWMALCRLDNNRYRSGINSFATSCLVIFFLQKKGILPSVHSLIKLENKSHIIAGWEVGFCTQIPLNKSVERSQDLNSNQFSKIYSTKKLLVELFSFYSKYTYHCTIICPFLGKNSDKKAFVNIDTVPEAMKNYKNFCQKNEGKMLKFNTPMCVQDPFELNQNHTKLISQFQLAKFKQFCDQSKIILHQK